MEQKSILDQIIEALKAEEFVLQKQLAFFTGQLQYNQKMQANYIQLQQKISNIPKEDSSNQPKRKSRSKNV